MSTNTTRRSVLKMTAALGVMTSAAPLAERISATSAFAQEATNAIETFPDDYRANPAQFAKDAAMYVAGMEEAQETETGLEKNLAPTQWAEYERAKAIFHKMHPGATPTQGRSEWSEVEDAMFNFAMACFYAGIEQGAAYEHLRVAQLGTMQRCMHCHGTGYSYASIYTPGADLETCTYCEGKGTVHPLDTTSYWAFKTSGR